MLCAMSIKIFHENTSYHIFLATLEYEAELRHKNEMKKLEAKMKAQYVSIWPLFVFLLRPNPFSFATVF